MPEPEKAEALKTRSPKGPKGSDGAARSLSARVERSLKDADRLLKKSPEAPAQVRAMAHLEQAKVSALLQLADAIRESRKAQGAPRG
jgi:hypothetical protein